MTRIFLAPILDDESIVGYIMRIALLNGLPFYKVANELLVRQGADAIAPAKKPVMLCPPLWLPYGLDSLAAATAPMFESAIEPISGHTLFPVVAPFLESSRQPKVLRALAGPREEVGPYLTTRIVATAESTRMMWCPACGDEDDAIVGFRYWRRFHQLPNLTYCPVHRVALQSVCGGCEFSVRSPHHQFLPGNCCPCGHPAKSALDSECKSVSEKFARKLATTLLELTRAPLAADICYEDISLAYRTRTAELELCNHGVVVAERLHELLQSHDALELSSERASQYGSTWLVRALESKKPVATTCRNLVMATLLFDDIDHLRTAIASVRRNRKGRCGGASKGRVKSRASQNNVERAKELLNEYLQRNPTGTRTEFTRLYERYARALKLFAREWYEEQIPKLSRDMSAAHVANSTRLGARVKARDREVAALIKLRLKSCQQNVSRKRRITYGGLLSGIPDREAIRRGGETAYPLTYALLKQYAKHEQVSRKGGATTVK